MILTVLFVVFMVLALVIGYASTPIPRWPFLWLAVAVLFLMVHGPKF